MKKTAGEARQAYIGSIHLTGKAKQIHYQALLERFNYEKDSRRRKAGIHWAYPPFWESETNPSQAWKIKKQIKFQQRNNCYQLKRFGSVTLLN